MKVTKSMRASSAVVTVALAMFSTALSAHADELGAPTPNASVEALTSQGTLKADTVTPDGKVLSLSEDASKAVVLNPRSQDRVSIGLPEVADRESGVLQSGQMVFQNDSDQTSVLANPTEDGVQLAAIIGSPSSPTTYTYPVSGPAGSKVVLDDDGGASVVDASGNTLAGVEAPWAQDANGKQVPTRFVLSDTNQLTQVVAHTGGDFAYPITADPKVYSCDLYTHKCVKFSKSETKSISKSIAGKGAYGTAIFLCTKIPVVPVAAVCVGAVTIYASALARSFKSAAKSGKCVELHFLLFPAVTLTRWKTVKC